MRFIVLLPLFFLSIFQAHAQEFTVHALRIDSVRTIMELVDPALVSDRFRAGEEFRISCVMQGAEIDSLGGPWPKKLQMIGGPMRGRSDRWVDGRRTIATSHGFRVRVKRRGRLVIPAFTAYSGGVAYRSVPLELHIGRSNKRRSKVGP